MKKDLSFRISAAKTITTELPAFIVGILNVTPDSFYEGSRLLSSDDHDFIAIGEMVCKMVENGADIIDVGAESTRPGFVPISEEEELRRLIPAIEAIRKVTDCPISVDTTKSAVMKAALDAGADVLNDISAMQNDKLMEKIARNAEIPVILMHNHDIMNVRESETVEAVSDSLAERVLNAIHAGIAPEMMILDAGIGFGKTYEQNLRLIRSSSEIRERALKRTGLEGADLLPVMMALSRKRCIGTMTGREVDQRLAGTVAANMLAVQGGASFLRVHDVAETKDMLNVLNAMEKE